MDTTNKQDQKPVTVISMSGEHVLVTREELRATFEDECLSITNSEEEAIRLFFQGKNDIWKAVRKDPSLRKFVRSTLRSMIKQLK